jgi:hypothetical protein
MAQHDYVIANQSGAAFRADLNNALAAIVSQNSGSGAPSVTYAYMPWADTASGLFKIRNAANSGWITLYQLDGEWSTLALEDGSATAPSLYFKGTDTGAYSPGADQFAIATGGVQRVRFGSFGSTFTGAVNVANLNGGQLAGFRNLLINGNPTINQRGYVSGTATSGANQYTLDRWRVVTSGQSISWTDSENVRTVTAPAGGVEQVIEGSNILSGTHTLNWTGTATATVNGSSVSKGGTVTLTGGTNATVRFSGGTFALAQLEPGTVATPFENRSQNQELLLCQRYYCVVDGEYQFDGQIGPGGGAAAGTGAMWYFPVHMRTAPTLTTVSQSGNNSSSISWTAKGGYGALGLWEWQVLDSVTGREKAAIVAASAEL